MKKKANHVVKALRNYVFPVFDLPAIIHGDNGKEFVNKRIEDVVSTWPGHVNLISGRPRYPQSQGLVEEAHYTLERMICAKVVECGDQSRHGLNGFHILCVSDPMFFYAVNVIVFYLSLQI